MTSLWIAEAEFRSTRSRGFGETPEEAVKCLINRWQEYCHRTGGGDPNMILAWRDSIQIARCDSGTGYVIGGVDSFWHDVMLDASNSRFDDLFELQSEPAPNV